MPRRPTPGAREHILDTAARLFYEHGVHAVGLQQVIDEYGCGKNLLYREFPSKDDLVVAWLERCHAEWKARVDAATEPLAGDPAGQLVAIVADAAETAACPGFHGCAMRNTRAEFPDPDHPAHRVSVERLASVRARLRDLAEQAHARDSDTLADRLMLIIDGVNTGSAWSGHKGSAAAAVAFAEDVIRAATPAPRSRRTSSAPRAVPKHISSATRPS
jgi:AcrR family transcriptional regulator